MTRRPDPISSVLEDEVDEPRVERLVQGVFQRWPQKPRRSALQLGRLSQLSRVALGLTVAFAAVAAFMIIRPKISKEPPSSPIASSAPSALSASSMPTMPLAPFAPLAPLGLMRLPEALAAPSTSGTQLKLSDGSSIELWPSAALRVVRNDAARVNFELLEGKARFDVAPQRGRTWAVHLGKETVEVVGTRFVVSRSAQETAVWVEEGTVRLIAGRVVKTLEAGMVQRHVASGPQTATLPTKHTSPAIAQNPKPRSRLRKKSDLKSHAASDSKPKASPSQETPVADLKTPAKPKALAPTPAPRDESSWRAPAERGDYALAYQRLTQAGLLQLASTTDPATLFLAVDVARGAGDPTSAVALLEALLRRFPTSSSADLASTMRARLLLEELDRPHAAALAYEQALSTELPQSLLETALFGRVRAWRRAKDQEKTKRAADDYRRTFPGGRWRELVDRWAP